MRDVEHEHIRHTGNALRHALGALLLAWRHAVRAAGIALLVGIAIAESVGALVTHHFPPYLLTHVVALAVGIAVAYCVGLTVLADELIKGTLALVRMALGEVEAGARTAAVIAEREVGDVWGWARRLVLGRDATGPSAALPITRRPGLAAPAGPGSTLRPSARTLGQFPAASSGAGAAGALSSQPGALAPQSGDPARLRVPPRLGAAPAPSSAPRRDETLEDIAATDAFRKTAPPAPADAHPVRADRLPRIEWAAEGLAAGAVLLQSALAARARRAANQTADGGHAPLAAEIALEAMPPLPPRAPAAASPPPPASAPPPAPAPTSTSVSTSAPESAEAEARVAPATVPLAPTPAPTVVAAPPTIPLLPDETPHPSPRPSSPVRTIPVITDDATREALDTALPLATAGGQSGAVDASASLAQPTTPAVASEDGRAEAGAAAQTSEPASELELEPGAEVESESGAHWEPPSRTIVLPPTLDGGATKLRSPAAAPLLDEDGEASDAEARGLWSRIGQALARSTTRPLRERGDANDTGDGAGDQRGR